MSWRMRVRHTTTYRYSAEVHASYNEARISPLDTPNQFTLEHRVEVHPAANLFRYRDYWGSRVHVFDLHQPHTELTVVGSSLVETAERTPTLDDTVAWDAIDAPGLTDRFFEFMTETTMTGSDDAIRQVARELRERPGPAAALSRLGEWLRAHVEYETGTTSVSTTAVEVLRSGRGVCQDYAHLGIAVLRAAGIPARYASGYLYPDELGGVVGELHQGESHAWLEAWVGDWHPLDPTSGSPVAERHVLVARGRDYSDVAPLKGVYHGGPSHSLDVAVELTRVA
jgi:transglutaminase-like putative cysteine protease